MRNFLFCLLLVSSYSYSQNTIGTIANTEKSLNGYTLFSPNSSIIPSKTFLINNCGEIVNEWSSNFKAWGVDYITEDGDLYSAHVDNQSTLNIRGNTGRIEKKDWDNNLLWGLTYSDTDFSFHHDYLPLPNGNILMVVAYRKTLEEAIASGRNPSTLDEGELYDERIIEIQPIGTDGAQIVWEWRLWDHLIQDFDFAKNNFGVLADHPELIDINFTGSSNSDADWLHISSIDYNSELDQILFSSPRLSEFYVIDHSTTTAEAATSLGGNSGMGGDILYRWGNPQIYDQGTADDKKLFGQHTVHWVPNGLTDAGKFMLFNNGSGRDFSSVDILNPPVDQNGNYSYTSNTSFMPSEPEWSYTNESNPEEFFSPLISSAYRLDNGNILVTEGTKSKMFEINPQKEIVWEYISPYRNDIILSQGDTNTGAAASWIFRGKRYTFDYVGFTGKDLTPSGYLEQNPIPENCSLFTTLSTDEFDLSINFDVYPNPINDVINIINKKNDIYNVELFTLTGQKIDIQLNSNILNTSSLNSGLYMLKINVGDSSFIKKIVKK
ncbi:aryl-sulfate sulfotransferase [Aquimarina sp. MMG015]|uniref:aryl-sulfate sulfotransferase n=1 Tax=Aquimarina sp. MMG015 TaxID=2822689 RepID=UPI001B3A2798|nr:aryl-sulfate sulfotransferase [Aquimarina sp. MMG015]MBQ4803470.1 aryl-sulfate sulfotransferase [Aquimarina sp. MMG015]